MFKNLFKKKKPIKEYEWYCIHCNYSGFTHDREGKLVGECPSPERYAACPLDLREKISNT